MGDLGPLTTGDECMKLLDNGWTIQLFANENNKYTAIAIPPDISEAMDGLTEGDGLPIIKARDNWIVDESTPAQAMKSLTDSVLFGNQGDGKDAG